MKKGGVMGKCGRGIKPSSRLHAGQIIQNQNNTYIQGSASDIDMLKIILGRSSYPKFQSISLKIFQAAIELYGSQIEASYALGIHRKSIYRYLKGDRRVGTHRNNLPERPEEERVMIAETIEKGREKNKQNGREEK